MFKHTLIITVGNCISKLLGLIRDASIAWLLGNTIAADALTTALRVPFLFRRLLGEGSLSMGLIRICQYEDIQHNTGVQATLYITYLITISILLLSIPFIFIPQLTLAILAPGFYNKHFLSSNTLELFRICLPYSIFAILTGGNIAILYTKKYFLFPALSPIIFNCTVLIGAYISIGYSPTTINIILAYSILFSGILQWSIQVPIVSKLKKNEPSFSQHTIKIKRLLSHVPIDIFTLSIPQLAFIFASTLTSFMPTGYVSALFYAERIIELPIGIFSSALGLTLLPKLITLHHNQNFSLVSEEITQQISFCCCIYLPATAGLMLIATPLIQTIFYHGSFTPEATQMTALALFIYAPGLPATALARILIAGNYAFNQHKKPFFSALIALTVSIISGLIFIYLLGEIGPPLGVSLGLWVYCILLWKNLSKNIPITFPVKNCIVQGIATICMFIISYSLIKLLPINIPLLTLLITIPMSISIYGALLWFADKQQLKELFSFHLKN